MINYRIRHQIGWLLVLFASVAAALISIPGWHHDVMIYVSMYCALLAVVAVAWYRKAYRWAWVSFWVLPPISIWIAVLGAQRGRILDAIAYPSIAAIMVAGLMLSFRAIFPAKHPT